MSGFLAVAAVVIVSPGPDTVLTIRNSIHGGKRRGLCTSAGVCAGQGVWALAAGVGAAALLAASRPAFLVVKIAGAAFLCYLGLRSLRSAARPAAFAEWPAGRQQVRLRPRAAFAQGLLSNLSNPKMAVFFVSLLPQFTGAHGDPLAAMLTLALIFAAMTFTWLAFCAAAAVRAGGRLRTRRAIRILHALSGTVLVGFGIRLATEHP